MAQIAVDVFGVIAGAIGIVGFGLSNVPAVDTSQDAKIRIAVGLGDSTMAGTFPIVNGFSLEQQWIGTTWDTGHINEGSFLDEIIDQETGLGVGISGAGGPGQQVAYIQLQAADDAVCMAYISLTWADGNSRGWLGDWGAVCSQAYYYSNVVVGDEDYVPDCTWIDGDHTNGIGAGAVQIYMEAFSNTSLTPVSDPSDVGPFCYWPNQDYRTSPDSPPFNSKTGFFTTSPQRAKRREIDPASKELEKQRRAKRTAEKHGGRVIVSSRKKHTASRLCGSELSYGPDFVSLSEGYFCDMQEKNTWPLCSESLTEDCYDLETHKLVADVAGGLTKREVSHSVVTLWD